MRCELDEDSTVITSLCLFFIQLDGIEVEFESDVGVLSVEDGGRKVHQGEVCPVGGKDEAQLI